MDKHVTTINLVFISLSIILLSMSANNPVLNTIAIALLFSAIGSSIVLSLWYKNNERHYDQNLKNHPVITSKQNHKL